MNPHPPTPPPFSRLLKVLATAAIALMTSAGFVRSQEAANTEPSAAMFIREYRVIGAKRLDRRSVERAVYPYLGPERRPQDVDAARASLEKAYHDAGYAAVSVLIPQQKIKQGVVFLQVIEASVGRLRVRGSRYHDIERLKRNAPSMAEGSVPNFKAVQRDIIALNRSSGMRVTPALRAGAIPGTIDIDLNVEDTPPLQGNLEINNRHNANTTPWRLGGGLSYHNLWQLGHSIGGSFQLAPERIKDAKVYSAYYSATLGHSWALALQGTKQDSDVSTLGGSAVVGRGEILGLRLSTSLPEKDKLRHSISLGIDHKHFQQDIEVGKRSISTPITYHPISLDYDALWLGEKHSTDLNAVISFQVSRLGTNHEEFNNSRYNANEGFITLRTELTHTRDLAAAFEGFGKLQGQLSSGPLINNEQLAGGGLSTVRGYLESTALGDQGLFSTLELRSPSLLAAAKEGRREWRLHAFVDAGYLAIDSPLPEQTSGFALASVGLGTRLQILEHLSGSLDAGFPLIEQGNSAVGSLLLTIRFMANF